MGHTVLVVPVPELEPFVRERTEHYDASFLSSDPAFVHAHVTVLGPFLDDPTPADLEAVAAIAADVPAFDFELDRFGEFADGILHLLPDPDASFRELTRRLVAAFPQCPPYGGAFAEPLPHLTVEKRTTAIDETSVSIWWRPRRSVTLMSRTSLMLTLPGLKRSSAAGRTLSSTPAS